MQNEIEKIVRLAQQKRASDFHIAGAKIFLRIFGKLDFLFEDEKIFSEENKLAWLKKICSENQIEKLLKNRVLDFSLEIFSCQQRLRMHAFYTHQGLSIAARLILNEIPNLKTLGCPKIFDQLLKEKHGLIFVCGATGSGKTTTLNSFIDAINETRTEHIITLEDPIEFIHQSKKSLVQQREFDVDFFSFTEALAAALREDPDVIFIGELRNADAVMTALYAAETGHLVLASLHTQTAVDSLLRLESFFPAEKQNEVCAQLACVLRAVIVQELLPCEKNHNPFGRELVTEVLSATPAVQNLIRMRKFQQLPSLMSTGEKFFMHTMQQDVKQKNL